ncbi:MULTISPECIES: hypothetical protein [Mycolicibacter]|uniref:Uncharacterized protein n=2 Tax=Mycolicibacter TaxID=1073531 RepID=A0ABU5XL68_9MYCO|nr:MULTISPECIES: hypothetical protein [unclassified Mycolicibacter]MEB3023030.1 hypothetical protein [Mycolicibacter sp. MYC098]MEB3033540.1 hypothetical protein [Mycolicibacter sp. MYC340]
MSYSATIIGTPWADGPPLWESNDHSCLDDAYRAGEAYIHATQPTDRILAEQQPSTSDGATHCWSVVSAEGAPVAALIVSEDED